MKTATTPVADLETWKANHPNAQIVDIDHIDTNNVRINYVEFDDPGIKTYPTRTQVKNNANI